VDLGLRSPILVLGERCWRRRARSVGNQNRAFEGTHTAAGTTAWHGVRRATTRRAWRPGSWSARILATTARNAAVSIRRLFDGSRFPGGDFRAFPLPNALAMSAGRRANGRFRSPPRLPAGPKVLPVDVPRSDWPPAVPLPREVTAKASRFKIAVWRTDPSESGTSYTYY
jgi:hypothetical protein